VAVVLARQVDPGAVVKEEELLIAAACTLVIGKLSMHDNNHRTCVVRGAILVSELSQSQSFAGW
jgi:hypothetical protein